VRHSLSRVSATPTIEPPLTRDRLSTFVLISLAVLGCVVCIVIAVPFLPAITWALALGVVAHPIHDWANRRTQNASLSAGIAVALITIGLLLPAAFVAQEIGVEATESYDSVQKRLRSGEFIKALEESPKTRHLGRWIRRNININRELDRIGEVIGGQVTSWVKGTMWTVLQLGVTVFLLFYLFRDRLLALSAVRSLLPLSERESDYLLERIRAVIHATIYGTLVVATVQGFLGGLMFWILGIPGALLWGFVMGLLSIIPVLGAFVIWAPAAVGLVLDGDWTKAIILAGWGTIVVGLIDNILYPILVSKEVRLHTVPVFIAILGGLYAFGASGLVLGPVVLAVTVGLIAILRRRTIGNRSAQDPT
jgi:predicted PurR-regulated permease PerM